MAMPCTTPATPGHAQVAHPPMAARGRGVGLAGWALGLWLTWPLGGCGAAPLSPLSPTPPTAPARQALPQPVPSALPAQVSQHPPRVQVVNHGWHTGLVLRANDVPDAAWPLKSRFPGAAWFEVGWGDRDFYRAADPGAWLALKAAVWPKPGVLHVVALDTAPGQSFAGAEMVELVLSPAGLAQLVGHLRNSLERDAAGDAIDLGPGLYGRSRFFASPERFHLFNTCNVWVAKALQAAGVAVVPAQAITADGLMAQLRPLAVARRPTASATAPASQTLPARP